MMSGEYWDGWFDHWGERHQTTDAAQQAQELDWILSQGYSINLYMFHGGTSFGFMNGANWDRKNYEPDVTSYDYDSPVSESGALTKKYFAFRDVIAKHRPGVMIPDPPAPLPVIEVPEFELTQSAALWSNLPTPISLERPRTMETFGQSYGYILYRTRVKEPLAGELQIRELRSYARVFVNGKLAGTLDRRKKQDRLRIEASADSTLDILVEGTGRINFTTELRNERQGITGPVTLAGKELSGWQVFPLPMDDLSTAAVFESESRRFARTSLLPWPIRSPRNRRYFPRHTRLGQRGRVDQRPCSRAFLESRSAADALRPRALAPKRHQRSGRLYSGQAENPAASRAARANAG